MSLPEAQAVGAATVSPTDRSANPLNHLAFLGLAAALCCYERLVRLTT